MVKNSKKALSILTLENGDRLSRHEFERRYQAMPQLRKAELVEGVVYIMASPLRIKSHGEPHGDLIGWLWLAVSALLSKEMATVLSVLQAGLATTEHQEFMQKLNRYGE
ncbi:hypothetical protein PCC6912_48410 [Chlorogloeopsis fritschii PCC 6912]|uniref:Uncharacterized protein n=1 Tax=Chlorogloeopsis fritschii PCC 6912 TaxID=211165 RepID=A0A3S0ZFL1_CHLFR|nr:hypothetical protein [Chlorogloeopsis fritschii]MBF2007327.1 hypothetical protein [Chlorogloeopsis fritschii C42_A2020_084]RUR75304.1 hypothetical protein PCC6912_48410 [Chlorogloeopsis fritschii PCC 6912]